MVKGYKDKLGCEVTMIKPNTQSDGAPPLLWVVMNEIYCKVTENLVTNDLIICPKEISHDSTNFDNHPVQPRKNIFK